MAQDRFDQFQLPNELRSLVEQSMTQARKLFDDFIDTARKTAENFQSQAETTRSGTCKAMGFAAHNVSASLEFAQQLVQVKDPAAVMKLQKDHLDRQIRALSEQANTLGADTAAMAKDTYKSTT